MSLAATFSSPYFTGSSRILEVPGRFHCALAGRPYMIDMARMAEFRRQAIPLLREQADNTGAPGEQTLSPQELWRRSQDDWTHGAGQQFLDREDSDNQRFRSSKGIDVWTRWQASLLPDTVVRRASASTALQVLPVGDRLYIRDGAALVHTADLVTFTAITGLPTLPPVSMATDGFTVFTAHGSSGIFSTTRGSTTAATYNAVAADLLGYAKGRLMVARAATLYNVTSTTTPAALFTHPNTDFRWVGFAEGPTAIYAAGFSGDKSLIYRTAVKPDGTALDIPVVAGQLPDGEIVRAIYGYLGFLCVGTDLGVRFCAMDEQGNLTIGALIRTPTIVRCFEGQDRFVWFGWSNYDATSTGLGRMDLSEFIGPLTPAYASDLMVTGQGAVLSVATFRNKRVLAVNGLGIYEQSNNLVASGTLDTGLITYGLPDLKTAVYLDVRVASPVDTNQAYISVDGGAFALIGKRSSRLVDPFAVGERSGETFEVRHELLNVDAVPTSAPVLTRYTLRAYPRPAQGETFLVPVLLHERVEDLNSTPHSLKPAVEFDRLVELRTSKRLVTLQIAAQSYTVSVDDALFQFSHLTRDGRDWNGTALIKAKSYAS
jgi:hypothetical protein